MSLINEALKKAQRARLEDQAATDPSAPAGTRIAKRGQPRSANMMVLIGAGAVVLVVLSVVATVYLLNRPATPQTAVASQKPETPAAAQPSSPNAPAVAITLPETQPPADAAVPVVAPTKAAAPAATSTPATGSASAANPTPAPPAPALAPATVPASPTADPKSAAVAPTTATAPEPSVPAVTSASAPAKPDERINAFIDTIRVMGIRSSGNESRVLMNDRVYRVNDIVERTLGVRLLKVEADSLTFSDANGVTYVKLF